MRILISIFLLVASSCLANGGEVSFYDSSGDKFNLANFKNKMESKYKTSYADPTFILIETPSAKDEKYLNQSKVISKMGDFMESKTVIVIGSCPNVDLTDGYYISKKNARKVKNFKVSILKQNGKTVFSSRSVLNQVEIEEAIKKSLNSP